MGEKAPERNLSDAEGGSAPSADRSASAQYCFKNEQPDWNYRRLILDKERQVQLMQERCAEESMWVTSRVESTAMDLPALRQGEVYGFYRELMGMTPSRRRKAIRHDPYRDPDLAELLLVESERALRREDPSCAERAKIAEWISYELFPGCVRAIAIRAFARILQAAARHLFGDPQGGEALFRSALDALGDCPNAVAWAYLFRTLARVRARQQRAAEAAAYLSRARGLYHDAGLRRQEQWCHRRLARLYLRLNEPGRAMAALARVEPERDSPAIEAEVLLGRAACLAAFDLHEPARRHLLASRDRRRWIRRSSQHRLPLEWWDARIALRLGDFEEAIPRLDAVRRYYLDFHYWTEACLASVELLLAYERVGTWTRENRPDVFGQLRCALEEHRGSYDFLPFAEDRADLEANLRDAAERLGRRQLPEALSCQRFLHDLQSLPPTPLRARVLFERREGFRPRVSPSIVVEELFVRSMADSAHDKRARDDGDEDE